MVFQAVQRQKFVQAVDGILAVPGNFTKNVLEMTVVLDHSMETEVICELAAETAGILKHHSQIFRNVRLNVVDWMEDGQIANSISAMPMLQTGRYFDHYVRMECVKNLDILAGYLKMYHARSKLILVLTNGQVEAGSREQLLKNINPFLKRKLLFVENCSGELSSLMCTLYLHHKWEK